CPSPAPQGRAADLVLTSGGASVGDRDVIAAAWERVGIKTLSWGVAMKPGKPLRFGRFTQGDGSTTLCFALPGNPLAALTGFEQFVAPALAVMSGAGWTPPPRLRLPLAEPQPAGRARTYFLRAGLTSGAGGASPAPPPDPAASGAGGACPAPPPDPAASGAGGASPAPPSDPAAFVGEALVVPGRQGSAMLREAALQPLVAVLTGPGDAPAGALIEAIAEPAALAGRVLRPVGPLPPAVGVRGRSNSGKTTLVEQLLPHLLAAGLRVGTVKHASHPPELDLPGKDSHRHGQAGARQVLLLGPGKAALYFHATTDEELGPWLEWFAGRVDVVVVEGFKQTSMPHVQIEVGGAPALRRGRQDGWPRWLLTRPEGEGGRFDSEDVCALATELVKELREAGA
ncbi:MAG: molybdopterin-guanine dinucleotide biosynthesis protein B, partial [Armatimonadetes bacterium]|nr:molybdopterin-guanine dinucleotide biosynthesis protein B [Armatimonadota bacterium]